MVERIPTIEPRTLAWRAVVWLVVRNLYIIRPVQQRYVYNSVAWRCSNNGETENGVGPRLSLNLQQFHRVTGALE